MISYGPISRNSLWPDSIDFKVENFNFILVWHHHPGVSTTIMVSKKYQKKSNLNLLKKAFLFRFQWGVKGGGRLEGENT